MKQVESWFDDAEELLERLRGTQRHWGDLPEIAGYAVLVEEQRGGQGVVYRARQDSTDQRVAIKVLLDGLSASEVSKLRFQREASLVASLRHPNIVRVHDCGTAPDGRLFYVMDYVRGRPIDDPGLDHAGDTRRTLALFTKVCDAIQYAHQRGVIHRDLKPSNILIDEEGEPRIIDFGLARFTSDPEVEVEEDAKISRTGQFLGSLAWASPEQFECAPDQVDVRSDVYALGVVLYQLVAGRLPHPVSPNLRQMLDDIATTPPPRPRSLRREIPADVETIVLRCLAKEPDRRYQTVRELGGDIRRFLTGRPIDAKRDNRGYVLRKTLARHKWSTALGAALSLSLVAFTVSITVLYRRAVEAEGDSRRNLVRAQSEAAKAQAVGDFLDELLASADPARDGRDVRVVELLDRGASQLETRFEDHPEVEAELRTTLGLSYRALGKLDLAAEQLELALDLRMSQVDVTDPHLLESMNELGILRVMRGDLAGAEDLLLRALDFSRSRYGETDELVLSTRCNLAALRNVQGRFPEAEVHMRDALEARRQTLGDEHPRTIRAMHNLALVLDRQHEVEEAEDLLREAVVLQERAHGREHIHTIRTKANLGKLLMERGDLEEAEPLVLDAFEDACVVLGEDHPEAVNFLHNAAVLRQYQGHYEEALELAQQALEGILVSLSPGHITVARLRNHVGITLRALGRYEEAERELLDAYESLAAQVADDHAYTQNVVAALIGLYQAWDRPEQIPKWRARLVDME